MSWWILTALAQAAWVPEPTVELADELLLEQATHQRLLVRAEPADALLTLSSEGLLVPFQAGPDGTLVIPSAALSRTLTVTADQPVELELWREHHQPKPPAWDRYERALLHWIQDGGPLPEPPDGVHDLAQDWEVRRQAFSDTGSSERLLWATLILDLELERARSERDHPTTQLNPVELADSETHTWSVQGPAILRVETRVVLEGEPYRPYTIGLVRDGTRYEGLHRTSAGEDPENPGLGWVRSVEIRVPPGEHEILVHAAGAPVQVDAQVLTLRPSWRAVKALNQLAQPKGPLNALEEMERQRAMGLDPHDYAQVLLEQDTLTDATRLLALARIVRHHPSAQDALLAWETDPTDPLLAAALARRWQLLEDVDPTLFVAIPGALPADAELLADLADALNSPFLRPRGDAIRTLGHADQRGLTGSRWTALPSFGETEVVTSAQAPGIPRVLVQAGQEAILSFEADTPGRYPVLRMQADEATRFTLDGDARRGQGPLVEGMEAGEHRLSVSEGELLLLDPDVVAGGSRVFERQVSRMPAAFLIPEPGAPVRVGLLVEGSGTLTVSTNDGASWTVVVPEPEIPGQASRVDLPAGAWATRLYVDGPDDVRVAATMRRTTDAPILTLPDPGPDPLATLGQASVELVELLQQDDPDPRDLARLRLIRAACYQALGFNGSARAEALLVVQLEGSSQLQRAQALASFPPVPPAEAPGPQTAEAALSRIEVLPPASAAGWHAQAESIDPQLAGVVFRRAASTWRLQGDVVQAWVAAEAAGDWGDLEQRRAESAGTWQALANVERGGGVVYSVFNRQAPDQHDGLYPQARELALGSGWEGAEQLPLRQGRQDRLELNGAGPLELELLCRDESFAPAPPPCSVQVEVDGVVQVVEIADGQLESMRWDLGGGAHTVLVHQVGETENAVVLRARFQDDVLEPQVRIPTHRIGPGIALNVAGPSLLRVRVHQGGPVTVIADGRQVEVTDATVLALTSEGAVPVRIEGPSAALVTLARLHVEAEEEEQEQDDQRYIYEPGAPRSATARATTAWMNAVATPGAPVSTPMGRAPTVAGVFRAGDDLSVSPRSFREWRYIQAGASVRGRHGTARRWGQAEAWGRLSLDGAPAIGAQVTGHWLPDPWIFTARIDGAESASIGHVRLRLRARYVWNASATWRVQPWAQAHVGYWTPWRVAQAVDPIAWTPYHRDHFAGLTLAAHIDYRPLRDVRVRLTPSVMSNAGLSVDNAQAQLRSDWLVNERWWLMGAATVDRRFQDTHRPDAFTRVSLEAGGTLGMWRTDKRWIMADARVRWIPTDTRPMGGPAVEGWIGLTIQHNRRRGLRDHAPVDSPYLAERDLPLELR